MRTSRLVRRVAGLIALLATTLPAFAGSVEYFHTDALGTPVAITDQDGNVLQRSEYEPYGKLLNRPVTDGPGYTGHVTDAATGLSYMQQRYYDPGIGRFLSVDPVTADGSNGNNFNRYWYAGDNPYKFKDPDGRMFGLDDAAGIVIGAAVGVAMQVAQTGTSTTLGEVAGSALTGAIEGEGMANAPETGGASLIATSAFASAAGDLVKQEVDTRGGTTGAISKTEVALSGLAGAATSAAHLPASKIPGLSSGRNSFQAIGKAVRTRIANGSAKVMSAKTAFKAAIGEQAHEIQKTIGGAAADFTKSQVMEAKEKSDESGSE